MFHGEHSLPRARYGFFPVFPVANVCPFAARRISPLPFATTLLVFPSGCNFAIRDQLRPTIETIRKIKNFAFLACARSTTFSRSSLGLLECYCDFSLRGRGTGTHPWQANLISSARLTVFRRDLDPARTTGREGRKDATHGNNPLNATPAT